MTDDKMYLKLDETPSVFTLLLLTDSFYLGLCSLDLNAAESGVQHKPSAPRNAINTDTTPSKDGCAC